MPTVHRALSQALTVYESIYTNHGGHIYHCLSDHDFFCVRVGFDFWKSLSDSQYWTVVPSWAGSSNFHWQAMPLVAKREIMRSAISSNLSVAKARMVGPAPDRQIPSRPGCVRGFID